MKADLEKQYLIVLSTFEEDNVHSESADIAVIIMEETARRVLCRITSIYDKGLQNKM